VALRVGAAVWLAIWLPAYWHTYGVVNFLHFCDIAVILTSIGLIAGSPLIVSSQAVATLLVDAAWIADVTWKLIIHRYLLGGTEYMFDPRYPRWVRLLSLFHIAMPALLLWLVRRCGYDRRALALQCGVALPAFIASRFTLPALNMNYAFSDPFFHRQWGPAAVHILVIFCFMVLVVYGPTDLVLRTVMPGREPGPGSGGD
jgi:hypothetical protein